MIIPAFITATITAFLCGILMKFGYVSFLPVLAAIVIGDLLSNVFWYAAGRIGGTTFVATFGRLFGIRQDHVIDSMAVFNKYKNFVSFFVGGPIGMIIMIISFMDAGIMRFSFWKYVVNNTLIGIIWTWSVLAIGYGFGYAYTSYTSIFGRVLVSVGLVIVLFIFLTLGGWIRMLMTSIIYKPNK